MAMTNINAKLITFNTSLPYTNVISRLDEAVNKQGSTAIMFKLKDAQSREEIDEIMNTITKLENDFLSVNSIFYFLSPPFSFHALVSCKLGISSTYDTIHGSTPITASKPPLVQFYIPSVTRW